MKWNQPHFIAGGVVGLLCLTLFALLGTPPIPVQIIKPIPTQTKLEPIVPTQASAEIISPTPVRKKRKIMPARRPTSERIIISDANLTSPNWSEREPLDEETQEWSQEEDSDVSSEVNAALPSDAPDTL